MGQCSSSEAAEVVFEYTGKGCVVRKDVTIVRFHPSVVEVESHAFHDCKQLREVVFHEGLEKIGWYAFHGCASLSSIVLPSTVTAIGYAAFAHCNNVREVILNDGLQKIGCSAFHSCISLPSIAFPSTVTEIGGYAFYNCNNLRVVVLHGVPREIAKNAFGNCTSLGRFVFPTISTRLNTLIQTGHWEEIENEVNEVRGVVERSGGELFVSTQTMGGGNNWNTVRRDTEKIVRLVIFYESQLPILDIAFTNACDIGVLGPVKDKVLQYLI